MTDERGISMSEFKTVVESFQSDLKKVTEVMVYRFDRVDERMDRMDGRMNRMEGRMDQIDGHMNRMEGRMDKTEGSLHAIKEHTGILTIEVHEIKTEVLSLKDQVSLLHEGQTEIKNDLKIKVERGEFAKLETRVANLENKVA